MGQPLFVYEREAPTTVASQGAISSDEVTLWAAAHFWLSRNCYFLVKLLEAAPKVFLGYSFDRTPVVTNDAIHPLRDAFSYEAEFVPQVRARFLGANLGARQLDGARLCLLIHSVPRCPHSISRECRRLPIALDSSR